MPTGSVGELKEEKRGSVASRCRRAALTCLARNSHVRFARARSLAGDLADGGTSLSPLPPLRLSTSADALSHEFSTLLTFRPTCFYRSSTRVSGYDFARVARNLRVYLRPSISGRGIQRFSQTLWRDGVLPYVIETEDAPVASIGGGGLAVAAVVVTVPMPVPVRKRKKKKRKKKTADRWWGHLFSTLHKSVGGGKATLKDRGDVVLAGTRRVFVHV